jgi:hypothetical protein
MAFQNIRNVTSCLGIDHLAIAPRQDVIFKAFKRSLLEEIYPPRALERAAAVCNTCMGVVKSYMLKTAIELGVPWIVFGWSPGQAPLQSALLKWNAALLRKTQESTDKILIQLMGEDAFPYLLREEHYSLFEARVKSKTDAYFYQVNPLAFFEYDEKKIIEEIMKFGWEPPRDTDGNSTNCLLNSFAVGAHFKKYGFHPYGMEISGLVREGHMTREEGLKKLGTPPDPKVVEYVKKKLKMDED